MLVATVIASAATIAGLFHDFGKANTLFQHKLDKNHKGKQFEPYRHEWVSLRLFQAFVGAAKTDADWLARLGQIDTEAGACFKDGLDGGTRKNHPINNLPPFAQLVAWLVVSHHKLAVYPGWKEGGKPGLEYVDDWFCDNFGANWNSYYCNDEDSKKLVEANWQFKALPYQSVKWQRYAGIFASEVSKCVADNAAVDYLTQQLFTTHLSRLCLILADHYYSSLSEVRQEWRSDTYDVWANTDRKTKQFKQKLDEHLIGVAHNAAEIAKSLPKLNDSLRSLTINGKLSSNVAKKHQAQFGWQDKAKQLAGEIGKQTLENGFFGVNMASTGTGKTLANAKIMTAIGREVGRIRFSVALGLRTLTLQTGRAYRQELDLNNELAIMVGGIAVKQLFVNEQEKAAQENQKNTGSESENDSFDDFAMDYQGDLSAHSLSDWTKNKDNLNKLIQAPVLVSTIDHLIPATEGVRGDKHIGAMLRLFTSDLVIDEPDDFGIDDLPALCRLVNWAGMLGSRVLLSTATMPPALSNALFRAYKAGWSEYEKANFEQWDGEIVCAWFDEFNCNSSLLKNDKDYKKAHDEFVEKRIKTLKKKARKHWGEILNVPPSNDDAITKIATTIFAGVKTLHNHHKISKNGKNISVGLVRFANIKPLVAVAKALLKMDAPDNTCIHYCVYHSKFPLALRSHIEHKLDKILNRKDENAIWQQPDIKQKFEDSDCNNHIFVVLASPVAEVGRDFDFDWAIIEPSSMRSIIQIAGRVLRHRDKIPEQPNILLLNQNYRALAGKSPCFQYPGFETDTIQMGDDDLNNILQKAQYQNITAIERISMPEKLGFTKEGRTEKFSNLVALEHKSLIEKLFSKESGAKLWWDKNPAWCGEMQRQQPFRRSNKDSPYYLWLENEYATIAWRWKNEAVYPAELSDDEDLAPISEEDLDDFGAHCDFWFDSDVTAIYQALATDFQIDLKAVSERFGEVRLVEYKNRNSAYKFHPNLGIYQTI